MKRTSPTAYCDCWEKCKCKALIAGQQQPRFELLNRLLTETDLVKLPNSRSVECNHLLVDNELKLFRFFLLMLIYRRNTSNLRHFQVNYLFQFFLYVLPKERINYHYLLCFNRGENILLFLVQTVGRQLIEQRQYRPNRSRVPTSRKAIPQDPGRYTCQAFLSHSVTCTVESREFVVAHILWILWVPLSHEWVSPTF